MLMRCRAIEQPCIAGFGREQDQPTNRDDASVVVGRSVLDMRTSSASRMLPPSTIRLPGPRLTDFRTLPGLAGFAMDLFTQLFGSLLAFVYHCFDRIVIYGYLSGLSRPERVVNFFHQVVGVPVVSREILSQRTADYQNWVEAFARNHRFPIEWAEKGVRKEDHVLPWQRRMVRADSYGVYYILKSMEQGPTFRVTVPKYPTKDVNCNKIAAIFGTRVNRRMRGKLATIIDRVEHGHHVFRAYFKHAFLKQYEKFATYLRNELVSNNLADFHLRKGLDHLHAVRERFQTITDRFAGFQAQWLNVHVDFPLLQRLALPITIGAVRYPGIKLHDPRVIRLFEVLLHGGSHVGGWTAKQIHQAVLGTFQLSDTRYAINQLRYDLRKLKGHGLLQRDGSRYAYRLSPKGVQVALLFLFFHKRLCGPLAHSRFHHRPVARHQPPSKLETAYHRADKAIQQIVDLLAA